MTRITGCMRMTRVLHLTDATASSHSSSTVWRRVSRRGLPNTACVGRPGGRRVIGLDAQTGVERWRFLPPVDSLLAPVGPGSTGGTRIDADDSTVFVPAMGASISAVDVRTGVARWNWGPANPAGFRSGANGVRVYRDTVYATAWRFQNPLGGLSQGWLVALDARTGSELWRRTFPAITSGVAAEGSPVVFGSLVVFVLPGGNAFGLDRATGATVWEFPSRATLATLSQAELWGGTVYFDGGDASVYALDASTGALIWRAEYGTQASKDLLVTARRVYVNGQVNLLVFDRLSGRRITALEDPTGTTVDKFISSAPVASDGRIFVNVARGVACFREP